MSAHEQEELGGFTDDPRAASVIFSGVVGLLVLTVTILALQALTFQYEDSENEIKNVSQQWTDRIHQTAQKETDLRRYRWIDKEKGVAGIPIDDAIRIVARESSRAQ